MILNLNTVIKDYLSTFVKGIDSLIKPPENNKCFVNTVFLFCVLRISYRNNLCINNSPRSYNVIRFAFLLIFKTIFQIVVNIITILYPLIII